MNKILDICFEGKARINPQQFKQINEEISSDTVLSVMGLFRERLPCSENFWRYKRNYDLHMKSTAESTGAATAVRETKRIASPKMRHVRALSPYAQMNQESAGGGKSFLSSIAGGAGGGFAAMVKKGGESNITAQRAEFQQKLDKIKKLQAKKKTDGGDAEMDNEGDESDGEETILVQPAAQQQLQTSDINMTDEEAAQNIPLNLLKSNQKKEKFIVQTGQMSPGGRQALEAPLSPGASFAMRDHSFK
mmetsp:Transcript_4635/g.7858  ORF Transcript_4635/g.7858 Transcript_4635/m.7858 type:complete len:248 (+) Transcript_4635:485-1228(+)